MAVPNIRLSPSGPPIDAAEIVVAGGAPFATRYRQASSGANYDATNVANNALFAHAVARNPVVPGTSAEILLPLPTIDAPPTYQWALKAQFTGMADVFLGAGESTHVAARIQYSDDESDWLPLSTTGSGTYEYLATQSGAVVFAMHALRNLADIARLEGQTDVLIRVGWSKTDSEGADSQVRMRTNTTDDLEGGILGGWDFTAQWVLRPVGDP